MSNQPSRAKNLIYAAVAAQAGCLTLAIVLGALFLGIWLDAQFHLRGPFVIGLLLISIPISLFFMLRVALSSVQQIQPPPGKQQQQSPKKEE